MKPKPQALRESREDFRGELDEIIRNNPTPESLSSNAFTEQALKSLISLVGRVAQSYNAETDLNQREKEDAALKNAGMDDVETYLDSIIEKDEALRHIDDIISHAVVRNEILLPPDPNYRREIGGGDEKNEFILRAKLKSILFALENNFDVDEDNPDEFSLSTGVITDKMMRRSSYYIIDATRLQRRILVNDEYGNVTYVLDSAIADSMDVSSENIAVIHKSDLDNCIDENPAIGKRVNYSKNFVCNIIDAIEDPTTYHKQDKKEGEKEERYGFLVPKVPEGWMNTAEMMKAFNDPIGTKTRDVIDKLGETLSPKLFVSRREGSGGGKALLHYSPEDVENIFEKMKNFAQSGYAPEGWLSRSGIEAKYGRAQSAVEKALDEMGEVEVKQFRHSSVGRVLDYYSPDVVKAIGEKMNKFNIGQAPDGFLTINAIAANFGVTHKVVARAVAELSSELTPQRYLDSSNKEANYYSTEDINKVTVYLSPLINAEKSPEGWKTAKMIASDLGRNWSTIRRYIDRIDISSKAYKDASGRLFNYYSPEDVEAIKLAVGPPPPQGYLSTMAVADKLGVSFGAVETAIKRAGDALSSVGYMDVATGRTLFPEDALEIISSNLGSGARKHSKL